MKAKVASEMEQARLDIEAKLIPQGPNVVRHLTLPEQGKSLEWILEEMKRMDEEHSHADYKVGKLSGAVYRAYSVYVCFCSCNSLILILLDGGDDLEKIIVEAYQRYCVSNPLHPDVFPTVRKMEAEIVSMCLRMYNNPDGAGTMTSGGTESIIMSVKTHRDWARAVKGITEPEMSVIPLLQSVFLRGQ